MIVFGGVEWTPDELVALFKVEPMSRSTIMALLEVHPSNVYETDLQNAIYQLLEELKAKP